MVHSILLGKGLNYRKRTIRNLQKKQEDKTDNYIYATQHTAIPSVIPQVASEEGGGYATLSLPCEGRDQRGNNKLNIDTELCCQAVH